MNKNIKENLKRFLPLSLCCIIPIVLLLLVPFIGSYSTSAALAVSLLSPFMCHILMGGAVLFLLFKGDKPCCSDNKNSL